MRRGFSMLTAIIFLILIATISALSIALSSQATKQTSDLFLRSQAELLAKSATEYTLLAISGHELNTTSGCLNSINSQYPQAGANATFDINITISYLGNGLAAASGNNCNILSDTIMTSDSNQTVIIDTIVSSISGISTEPIRIHRRTIQKP